MSGLRYKTVALPKFQEYFERKLPRVWNVTAFLEICPGLNANEIQIPYDEHHKASSSLVKSHQNTQYTILSNLKSYENVK